MLAEAETVCSGITKNTTAKLTSQHGLIYDKLIRTLGVERAKGYLSANQAALQKYRVAVPLATHCDFRGEKRLRLRSERPAEAEPELAALENWASTGNFGSSAPSPSPRWAPSNFQTGPVPPIEIRLRHFKGPAHL